MTNKTHYPLIRAIYLYLFALLGLMLLTIGSVRFVDMGLKAFVFTKAEEQERLIYKAPPMAPLEIRKLEQIEEAREKKFCLSQKDRAAVEVWLAEYKEWKEKKEKIDPVTARRHRDASLNLAMILIGLPLYLYHWRIIKRETKNRSNG
jgi:hypothetical protein